jgi:hypothetical protein
MPSPLHHFLHINIKINIIIISNTLIRRAAIKFCFRRQILVGSEILTAVVMKSSIFWDIMLCSPLKISLHFGATRSPIFRIDEWAKQDASMKQVTCRAYSWILKMEVVCSSETSVDFQRSTRRYIPEDRTLLIKLCLYIKKKPFLFMIYVN